MGKSTPSAPPQPNPADMARNQQQMNILTAAGTQAGNNVNQITPYGNIRYDHVADFDLGNGNKVPRWQMTQTLSPEQQKLYDSQTAISQGALDLGQGYIRRIGDATATPFNYDGLPDAPKYDEAFRQAQLAKINQRAQPQQDRIRAQLEQQLADRGVGMQDPAYRTALDQYQRGQNDFMLGADLQSGQEAQNQFNLQATTRDRAIQERANLRSQPINEISALLGLGSGGVRAPQFVNTPQTQIANTDTYAPYAMQQQAALAQQQMATSQNNALMGGLFGLGSAGLMAGMMPGGFMGLAKSDIRTKRDIRHVGHTNDGQRLYTFRYIDGEDTHLGLMAQEVEQIKPDAVVEIDGIKYVDYAKALANG